MLRYKIRLFGRAKTTEIPSQGRAHKNYADLIWHLQRGDRAAWEQFTLEWGMHVYSYLRYNTECEEDAQLVLSETMVAVVHEIANFDESVSLATFVYKLAYHQVKAYWQRCGKPDLLTRFSRMKALAENPVVGKLWSQLEEQAVQILLLRYLATLSISEIADVLGRSYDATELVLAQSRHQFQCLFFSSAGV
jgi:DNA-directed RNA polymerase specialized sigma24 family protein